MKYSKIVHVIGICTISLNLNGCVTIAAMAYAPTIGALSNRPSDESYLSAASPDATYSSALQVIKLYNGFEETDPKINTIKGLDPAGYYEYNISITPSQNSDESILEVKVNRIQPWAHDQLATATTDGMQKSFISDLKEKMGASVIRSAPSK